MFTHGIHYLETCFPFELASISPGNCRDKPGSAWLAGVWDLPSGSQTWRAAKWTIYRIYTIGDVPSQKPPFSSRIFQPAMFDYQGVSSGKHEENVGTAWTESEEQPEVDQRKTVFFSAGLSG